MSKITFRTGNARVTMDDTLGDIALRAVRDSHPAVVNAIERTTEDHLDAAISDWPVGREKTRGVHSVGLLDSAVDVLVPDEVRGRIFNTAKYARFIKGKRHGGRSTFRAVFVRPGRERGKRLVIELTAELLALLHGGR